MAEVTIDDLRDAELAIKRTLGRVETQRKRLAGVEAELADARAKHAELVKQYGEQHCPGTTPTPKA